MTTKQLALADVAGGIGMVGDNVPKAMDGRKTQTRRVEACLKDLPSFLSEATKTTLQSGDIGFAIEGEGAVFPVFPRYQPGKVYYVKEALINGNGSAYYKADNKLVRTNKGPRRWKRDDGTPWKPNVIPAIYMPKSAARTFIKILDVECERLHDISVKDIKAEGVVIPGSPIARYETLMRKAWRKLWNECNGKGAWELNPWVFVYEFETVEVAR